MEGSSGEQSIKAGPKGHLSPLQRTLVLPDFKKPFSSSITFALSYPRTNQIKYHV